MYLFIFLLGAALGSFTAAFSYRYSRKISIIKVKRSFCESCGHTLAWYDNIPLLSFLFLRGRCRYCSKSITWQTFLAELAGGLLAVLLFSVYSLSWQFFIALPIGYLLFAICLVDLDKMIIPDEFVWALFPFFLILRIPGNFFVSLLTGFLLAIALLFLHWITRGRGMGLGDVKLVIPLGFFTGWPVALYFFWWSFILGSIYGILALVAGKKHLKSKVPFGPFIVLSFLIFWGKMIL